MPRLTLPSAGALAGLVGLLLIALPGSAEARPRCAGKKATRVGTEGRDVIVTKKKGRQVIVAGGGDDLIIAKRNRDIICGGPGDDLIFAGPGRDKVRGGAGNDYLDLGPGGDKARGGGGADTIDGAGGADRVHGGPGADRVLGGIQDDKLWGDGAADLVSGGQGMDRLRGGGGDDWLRGDTNRDKYAGGGGSDTLSFATATPPGPFGLNGVLVNLRRGKAFGDDARERVKGIENVVGSIFKDRLVGGGGGFAIGGLGSDSCSRFRFALCRDLRQGGPLALIANGGSADPGLVLIGGGGADDWTVSGGGFSYRISGSGLQPGAGCDRAGGDTVVCSASRPLGYVLAWGGGGGDRIAARDLPTTVLVKLDGGPGSDVLAGGGNAELLHAGESGADRLFGGGGDDALVSRGGGADRLFGGGGNDQLVTDTPCGGHHYSGGPGTDVAGFGHVQRHGVKARIGGKGRFRRGGRCHGIRIRGDNEVLEGSRFKDVLIASGRGDLLIGRAGNDRCLGGRHRRC